MTLVDTDKMSSLNKKAKDPYTMFFRPTSIFSYTERIESFKPINPLHAMKEAIL
jgi:hypothetical protein